MDIKEFMRECYLKSEPSVDLDAVSTENPVDCREHTIHSSVYDEIVERFVKNDEDRLVATMFMIQSGPQIVLD